MESLKSYHRLSELLSMTIKKWRLCLSIFVISAIVIIGGANVYLNKHTKIDYSTTASLIVSPYANNKENSDPQTIQYYMNTFKMALGDNHYLSQMQSKLTKKQQTKTVSDFGAATAIDNPGGTTILTIKVTDQDPQKAVYTANLIAKQATKDTYALMKSGKTRIITKSIDAAPNQVVNKKKILGSILVLVVMLSILVTFIIVYFAPNIQGTGIIKDNLAKSILTEITDEKEVEVLAIDTLSVVSRKLATTNLGVIGMASSKLNQQIKAIVEANVNVSLYEDGVDLSTTGIEFMNIDSIVLVIEENVTSRKQLSNAIRIVERNLDKQVSAVLFIKHA